mmetsp:Transcript_72907/g.236983  ORF Transcript_72907/g.236983 Transcript_72907/m.236983 type:complete len:208 (-) Transcript_72907:280-903(-)
MALGGTSKPRFCMAKIFSKAASASFAFKELLMAVKHPRAEAWPSSSRAFPLPTAAAAATPPPSSSSSRVRSSPWRPKRCCNSATKARARSGRSACTKASASAFNVAGCRCAPGYCSRCPASSATAAPGASASNAGSTSFKASSGSGPRAFSRPQASLTASSSPAEAAAWRFFIAKRRCAAPFGEAPRKRPGNNFWRRPVRMSTRMTT